MVDGRGVDENAVLYITNDLMPVINDADIVIKRNLESVDVDHYNNIIVNKSMLADSSKNNLQKALLNHSKIIITGNISENSVREYFGLELRLSFEEESRPEENVQHEDNMVDVSQFGLAGRLIYKHEADIFITPIRVENIDNSADLLGAFKYCFNYDYANLIDSSREQFGIRYSNAWSSVGVNTETYVMDSRGTINTAIAINKNDGNPNSNDQYLSHVRYTVDTDMNPGWFLDRTEVEVRGRQTSLIYDYGPNNMTNPPDATISFNLPFTLSISFSPGPARINIRRVAGGIDSNNCKLRFNAVSLFGISAVTDAMFAQADIQSYQSSSGFFFGYGQFYATTNGYQGSNSRTYFNSIWDSINGS